MTRLAIAATFPVFLLAIAAPALAQADAGLPAGPISRAQVTAAIKQRFASLDTDHDGAVSRAEFDAYRQKARPEQGGGFVHIGEHWFERSDADGDGRVTLSEALARPMQLFDMADTNHDGVVSVDERKLAMMLMGPK